MKNLSILLALTIILFSCKQKEKITDNIIDLTLITEPNVTNLSELGSEITYIPLETNESCLLENIDKLIYESESFFLGSIDRYYELPEDGKPAPPRMPVRSLLLRFSKSGEFICQIGSEGKGPSEYQHIKDFLFNNSNNTIELFSPNNIKEYSLDGIWKKDITLDYDHIYSLFHTNNQFLTFINNVSGQDEYSFVLFDENGKIIKKFENKYKNNPSKRYIIYLPECVFYNYDEILHCKELHSDTIFSFNNGTFIPKYILNQGEAKYTSDLSGEYFFKNGSDVIVQTNLFETKNYLLYQYGWKDRHNCFVQNKSNETQYLIDNGTGLVNDLDNGPNFKIHNTVSVDGTEYLISWVNAFDMKAHVESVDFKTSTPKYPEKKRELEKLANNLSENDNPVLMLVKLKASTPRTPSLLIARGSITLPQKFYG